MPASQEQKVDFLLKKIGYSASKTGIAEDESAIPTGSNTPKAPFEEGIPSPLIIPQSSLWADSGYISTTPPGSDTAYVKVYSTSSPLRMTRDASIGTNTRTYIAYTTYNNTSSARLTNWIDTQFGASYILKVYKDDPTVPTNELTQVGANNQTDGWFFDYSSGILNFNGVNLPSGITATNIYIVGYRYIGATGARPPAGIGTFENLYVAGVSTFMGSIDANSNLDVAGISTFQGLIDANGLIEATAGQNKIPSLYANYSDLPNAGTYHGMFAHVHQHARGYFAHAGNWLELVNKETDGRVGTGTETYNVGFLDATNLDVTGITTLGSIGISTGRITGPAITYIDPVTVGDDTGLLVVKGNLQVEGTQTTVNSSTMTVTDKNIELAKGAANNAAANGGGITIDAGSDTDKTWQWVGGGGAWTSSEHIQVAAGKRLGFADDFNTYIDRPSADEIRFTTGGTERVVIDTDGRLRVGDAESGGARLALTMQSTTVLADNNALYNQTNPAMLHLWNRNNDTGTNNGGSGSETGIILHNTGGGAGLVAIYSQKTDNNVSDLMFRFRTGTAASAERVRIKSTGQVAIGTTVEGQVSADELTLSGSGSVGMTIRSTNSTESNIFMSDATTGSGEYAGWIKFKHNTTPNRWEFGAVNTQILNILADGKVGINSDAPPTTFDVNGTSQFQDDVTFTGSAGYDTQWDKSANTLKFHNNHYASFGVGDKLTIRHTGVNGYIEYNSGALFITPATTNTASYLQLDGGEGLYLKHRFSNGGQQFALKSVRSEGVELYHSGNKKFATSGIGVTVTGLHIGTFGHTMVGITTILDEDNMASNSATALVTQQSLVAYVGNSAPGGSSLAVSADSGSNETINLSSEVLDIEGTANEIETATGTNKVVIGLPNDVSITNLTLGGTVSAGSTTGTDGYYLKSTGIGVTWAVLPSSRTTSTQTATAGQTSFNFNYNVGFVDVFLNGVKLPSSEFTASNGSTVVLDDAAFANDTLEFISLNTVPVSSGGGASNLTGLADVTISGTPVIGETLQHNGSQFVNDYTVSTTTTSTSQTAILNLPVATYRSVEYTIQMTEGTKYHVTKVLAIHNGTNVYFNEYGTLFTNNSLSTFTLDVNSGNMRLLATPASTNSTVFKIKFTGIKV